MKITKTERGFERCEFKDHNDEDCMLLQSGMTGSFQIEVPR